MNLPEIPKKFKSYGNLSPMGTGTQGTVYRFDGNKEVVLKVIECTTEIQYQSTLHEIEIMNCLANCSQVIRFLDHEIAEEADRRVAYLLLEYAERLDNSLSLMGISAKDAVELCIQLCDALIECRDCGVMHLDIKPQNLFLDNQGNLKLGDFGVSLYQRELQDNTLLRGSLNYVAPEVYRNHRNSELSEIYSVGMVLYWLLNNRKLPFEQGEVNSELILYKRLAGTAFPKIPLEDTAASDELVKLFQIVCAFEPTDRPQSFEALRTMLCGLRESVPDGPMARKTPIQLPTLPMGYVGKADTEQWNSAASGMGDSDDLTDLYINGSGIESSSKKALEWYKKAAEQSNVMAQAYFSQKYSSQDADGFSSTVSLPGQCSWDADDFSVTVSLTDQVPQNDNAVSNPVPQLTEVQFSAVAPKKFIKGEYTMIELVMYEEQYRAVVDEIIAYMDEPALEKKSGIIPVAKHSQVRIVLSSPDLEIEDNEEQGEWNGKYLNFNFAVFLPEKYSKRQVLFLAKVYVNDLMVTTLKFAAKCHSLREQKLDMTRQDVMSAFISYASQDRNKVVTIIQGMKKIVPDMDIFFDVESLRSGEKWEAALRREIEKRDVLFLCWSHYAKESKWVEMEWKYALENKGEDFIEPIPIEHSSVCPPPKELEQKHFNDKLLYLSD